MTFICMIDFVNFFAFIIILQVRLAILDLQLHSKYNPNEQEAVLDFSKSVCENTYVYPMLQEDRYLCSSTHLFTGLLSLSD